MDSKIDKNIKKVINHICSIPEEEPTLYFTYPKDKQLTIKEFIKWVDMVGFYKSCAERFEEQERGSPFCVDRAVTKYFRPECSKMFNFIIKNGLKEV